MDDDKNNLPASGNPSAEEVENLRRQNEELLKEKETKEKELSQAQYTIMNLKKKSKEDPVSPQQFSSDEIQEQVAVLAQEEIQKEIEKFKVEQSRDFLEETLSQYTSDPELKNKILETYQTRIVKSGFDKSSITRDIGEAMLLANKPILEKTLAELKHSSISKSTQSGGTPTTYVPDANNIPGVEQLSAAEKAWVKTTASSRKIAEADLVRQLLSNRAKMRN